uniref:Uncharacterized protein n=1 Tax=Cacopsylla melanoneura TaxID=428564 RepID=A0A8D8VLC3_9HEMI
MKSPTPLLLLLPQPLLFLLLFLFMFLYNFLLFFLSSHSLSITSLLPPPPLSYPLFRSCLLLLLFPRLLLLFISPLKQCNIPSAFHFIVQKEPLGEASHINYV